MSDTEFQPPISAKQAQIPSSQFLFNLISGPRKASKSWGCLHAIPWHMWNTQDSAGMMLGQSTTQNSDAGLWSLLTEKVMPIWLDGDFGLEWVTKPKMHPVTHKLHFQTSNRFGGASTFFLESLEAECHVEKFKNKVYDLIYGTEFSNFKQRKTFDILKNCFRGRPLGECRMYLDTNPAEEGEESWMYQLFWWFRTVDLDTADPEVLEELGLGEVPEGAKRKRLINALKELQSQLNVIEFDVDDNVFISQEERDGVYADHAHDPDLLARYYYGRWVKASGDGIFREVWRPDLHVVGEAKTPAHPNPEIMVPEEDCIELGSGSDIGRRNTAIVLVEPFRVGVPERDPTTGEEVEAIKTGFKFLDEYVVLGRQQKLDDLAAWWLKSLDLWQSYCKGNSITRHISDHSAFSADLQSESDEAKEIYRLTRGRIELESVVGPGRKNIKGHGSVELSISLVQRLLLEGRILVSKSKCPNLAQMFASMCRNNKGKLSPTNIQKHVFDAARYYIMVKCWHEMIMFSRRDARTQADQSSGIISTRL